MIETIVLNKENPLLPAEDYDVLRRTGIEMIEKLGSDIWTDYNTSDPGITILEAVCYAITDLAYRTGFEIKDLLAPELLKEDTWDQIFYTARQILHNNPLTISDYRKIIIDVTGVRNAWIEPSKDYEVPVWVDYNYWEDRQVKDCGCDHQEIKMCFGKLGLNPITEVLFKKSISSKLEDLTKQFNEYTQLKSIKDNEIVDLKLKIIAAGTSEEQKKLYTSDFELKIIEYDKIKKIIANLEKDAKIISTFIPSKIVEFEGLYNVMVEYEEDILDDEQREEVRQKIMTRLSRQRNLCEDFLNVVAVDYLDMGLGASIVLEEYADSDAVVAEIFFIIYKYFTPSVPFHTISQMLEKGLLVDEIFEGPPLKHGFIDTTDLEKTDLFRDIRLSDIINEISDIEGIKAITYLSLPFISFNEGPSNNKFFNEWLQLLRDQRKIARIQPALSKIICCKEQELITYNTDSSKDRRPDRMLKLFRDKKTMERKYKLTGHENDFPIPVGEYSELEDYYPITYSLPMTYGVSDRAGLPLNSDKKREIQALQLKGYLLFFEQLLSDYLVQLNHLRDLFSFDDSITHTSFSSALKGLNDLQSLLIDHQDRGSLHFDLILKDFGNVLQNLVETPKDFNKKRNQFLNHLLARFGEDLSEYESISKWLTPYKVEERMIADKIRLLKDGEYYNISSNRGKGFDYSQAEFWNTLNISGAERRIGRLLGFNNVMRRTLSIDSLVVEPAMELVNKVLVPKKNKKGQPLNVIKLLDPEDLETILLTSVEVVDGCCTDKLLMEILAYADNRQYYKFHNEVNQRSRKTSVTKGTYWFELYDSFDPDTAVLLATGEQFSNQEDREASFKKIKKLLSVINDNEGMHLVEHLLLRPKLDEVFDEVGNIEDVKFLDICLDECDLGIGLNEGTQIPPYYKKIRRIPAEKCYDKLPWVLEYWRIMPLEGGYAESILFQETSMDSDTEPVSLKFTRYEALTQRVQELHEFGSERVNYKILYNGEEQPEKIKYSFIIHGDDGKILAQSPYIFNKRTKIQVRDNIAIPDDIELEIQILIDYFGYQLDLYCDENPCDNNEDPYSFRATAVLPCWPKRFSNPTFRHLVEKTILTESPAHVHTRVVWVGFQEMQRFENAYCDWLQEMAQTEIPSYEKVNPLIEVLNTLKPCSECEDDCS